MEFFKASGFGGGFRVEDLGLRVVGLGLVPLWFRVLGLGE